MSRSRGAGKIVRFSLSSRIRFSLGFSVLASLLVPLTNNHFREKFNEKKYLISPPWVPSVIHRSRGLTSSPKLGMHHPCMTSTYQSLDFNIKIIFHHTSPTKKSAREPGLGKGLEVFESVCIIQSWAFIIHDQHFPITRLH